MRGLGFWASTAVVIGSMIGQSVFLVASDMSREVGSMWKVLVAWIAGGVIVLFGALCYAELGAALPEAGGDYVYLSRGLGPWGGFLYGWTFSVIMRPGAAAGIAAGLMRFVGFLGPSVTAPIFVLGLHLSFLSRPYQVTFTAAQPLAAVVVVFVTVLSQPSPFELMLRSEYEQLTRNCSVRHLSSCSGQRLADDAQRPVHGWARLMVYRRTRSLRNRAIPAAAWKS